MNFFPIPTQGRPGDRGERGEPGDPGYIVSQIIAVVFRSSVSQALVLFCALRLQKIMFFFRVKQASMEKEVKLVPQGFL